MCSSTITCKPSAKVGLQSNRQTNLGIYGDSLGSSHKPAHQLHRDGAEISSKDRRLQLHVYYDYPPGTITNILEQEQWEILQARRSNARLTMMYKMYLHGVADIPSRRYVTSGDSRTRGAHRLREIPSSKDAYKFSFFPRMYDSRTT